MFKRQKWASLLGVYVMGVLLYALLMTPGFTPTRRFAGLHFMLTGLALANAG